MQEIISGVRELMEPGSHAVLRSGPIRQDN